MDATSEDEEAGIARERGVAVHEMLERSHANGWAPPAAAELRAAHAAWTGSELFASRVRDATRSRAEVPLLMQIGGTVLRGEIDLLVESEDDPPLIVDYKTDQLGEEGPAAHAERYATQRGLYAVAVAEALGVETVEVAYVFLERPEEPVLSTLGPTELGAARERLEAEIAAVRAVPALSSPPAAPASPPARRGAAPPGPR